MAYARIEAYYNSIPDLLDLSARRFCNLVVEWTMQHVDPEVWDKEYKDIFFGDPKLHQMRQQSKARMAPAQAGQGGSLNIKVPEKRITEGDLSQFFGRAGGSGKSDPNKAVLRERGNRSGLTIGPDADGNLSVSTDGDEG